MPVGRFFADFLCRELKLVIELDGFSHDLAPERDAARDRWMSCEGYTVLRFANAEVHGNLEGVVTAIDEAIARLRVTGPPLTPPASGRGMLAPQSAVGIGHFHENRADRAQDQ